MCKRYHILSNDTSQPLCGSTNKTKYDKRIQQRSSTVQRVGKDRVIPEMLAQHSIPQWENWKPCVDCLFKQVQRTSF